MVDVGAADGADWLMEARVTVATNVGYPHQVQN